jgi:hypothetical protein
MSQQRLERLEAVETMATKVLGKADQTREKFVRQEFDDYATRLREELIKSVERRAAELIKNR